MSILTMGNVLSPTSEANILLHVLPILFELISNMFLFENRPQEDLIWFLIEKCGIKVEIGNYLHTLLLWEFLLANMFTWALEFGRWVFLTMVIRIKIKQAFRATTFFIFNCWPQPSIPSMIHVLHNITYPWTSKPIHSIYNFAFSYP